MTRSRVGPLVLGSTIVGLLIGAVLIAGLPASSAGGTPRLQGDRNATRVDRSESPATIPGSVEWRFSEPQPDWKSELPLPGVKMAELERTTDALRLTLSEGSLLSSIRLLAGGIYIDLPDWRREEWAEVLVRARTTSTVNLMSIGLDPREGVAPSCPACLWQQTFQAVGGQTPIVRDGLVHTYRIHLDWGSQGTGPWRRVGFQVQAMAPGSIDILSVSVVPAVAGQGQARVTETILQPPQLKSDFALFRRALEEAHPALYRYTTKQEMDAEFASAEAKLTRPMTILQFRNALDPVLAAIRDGHTQFASFQGDEISAVIDSSKQFPLALTFEPKHAFVLLNQGLDGRVKPGMELLAINGKPLPKILQRILPNLTSDGDIQSWKMYQLGMWVNDIRSRSFFQVGRNGRTGFSEAYRLYVNDPPSFKASLRDPLTGKTVVVDLAGVTAAEAAVNVGKNPVNRDVLSGLRTLRVGIGSGGQPPIRYLDGGDTAILADLWGANFPDVLKREFAELRNKGTKNLIIDVRGNTGGFDQYPPLLFSYLTSKEFRDFERVHMNTYQPSFKRYTDLEIDPATDPYFGPAAGIWKPDPTGGWLMTEKYPTVAAWKPSENGFDGPVYVLIDGGSFSAGAVFPALAALYKRATFIGEETGGAAEGSSGGGDGITAPTLPESHLHIGIPSEFDLLAGDTRNRRRGTLPQYTVTQTIDDLAKGRDTVLEFTRDLIRSGKGR